MNMTSLSDQELDALDLAIELERARRAGPTARTCPFCGSTDVEQRTYVGFRCQDCFKIFMGDSLPRFTATTGADAMK